MYICYLVYLWMRMLPSAYLLQAIFMNENVTQCMFKNVYVTQWIFEYNIFWSWTISFSVYMLPSVFINDNVTHVVNLLPRFFMNDNVTNWCTASRYLVSLLFMNDNNIPCIFCCYLVWIICNLRLFKKKNTVLLVHDLALWLGRAPFHEQNGLIW